jgi:glycosyltransferase involved in cell wall biosynthesis
MNPIRVLELRSVLGTGGGPEKTILSGAALSDPAAFAVTVCYVRADADDRFDMRRRAEALGLDYVELRERSSIDPAIWRALCRLVAERRIEIVHAHDYKTDLLAVLLAGACGVIAMATAHGWTGHSARERLLYYPADKRLLRRCARVVAVSGEIRSALIGHGADPDRVVTILNGIDHRRFKRNPAARAAARATFGLREGDLAIGAVGRLEPQKRFDLLIDAVAAMRTSLPHARLLIAGDGSLATQLAAHIRTRGMGDACRLLGHTTDVIGLHHALDLLAQSSDYEGTPNAVLEAMALETPVVATAAGGTAELVIDGVHGRIVPVGDGRALRDAMLDALTRRDDAAARAAAARLRVAGELSFDVRNAKIEAIYRDLVRRNGTEQDGEPAQTARMRPTNSWAHAGGAHPASATNAAGHRDPVSEQPESGPEPRVGNGVDPCVTR